MKAPAGRMAETTVITRTATAAMTTADMATAHTIMRGMVMAGTVMVGMVMAGTAIMVTFTSTRRAATSE
ncbi:hypothetical protein ATO13_20110 [Stappia sp. 22II-S9-Z10]|nr:hypothetical protein ATO13_20110 [Stappia sp. 22II-S9-Z10]